MRTNQAQKLRRNLGEVPQNGEFCTQKVVKHCMHEIDINGIRRETETQGGREGEMVEENRLSPGLHR